MLDREKLRGIPPRNEGESMQNYSDRVRFKVASAEEPEDKFEDGWPINSPQQPEAEKKTGIPVKGVKEFQPHPQPERTEQTRPGEPVFLLHAGDMFAIRALQTYLSNCTYSQPPVDAAYIKTIEDKIKSFIDWENKQRRAIKQVTR